MYDEKTDFIHHEKEIEAFLAATKGLALTDNMVVLDLGAGSGMHCGYLTKYFKKVYVSDIINYSSIYGGEFSKLLKEKHQRNGVYYDADKIHFIESDAMDLLFRDDFFDIVISINTFEHIPDTYKALGEIIRVTKPSGYIYITFDPIWTADTGSHFNHLVKEPWEHLINNNYSSKMKNYGATDEQVNEFNNAMNRKRLEEHKKVFNSFIKDQSVNLISYNDWKGLVDENNFNHENFSLAMKKGYSKEELLTRGMCYVLQKNS